MKIALGGNAIAGVLAAGALSIAPASAQSPCGDSVTVEAGDTLVRIAERCEVDVATLEDANPDVDPRALAVGQTLRLTAQADADGEQTADANGEEAPPFGDDASVAYASQLWQVLQENNLVGEDPIRSYPPYQGNEPHGLVLEQVEGVVTVDGREGRFIIKTNFMAEDITVEQVQEAEHETYLNSWTVMLKREEGYAPESEDWFWAKWMADGEFDTAPNGLPLAGRVQGCIQCHGGAAGSDFVFSHNRYAE